MKRACANCQKEFDILPSHDESHGICRRHIIEFLKQLKFSDEEIKNLLNKHKDDEFCKDLAYEIEK